MLGFKSAVRYTAHTIVLKDRCRKREHTGKHYEITYDLNFFFYPDCPLDITLGYGLGLDFCYSLYKKFKVNDVTCRSASRPTDCTQERLLKHQALQKDVAQGVSSPRYVH